MSYLTLNRARKKSTKLPFKWNTIHGWCYVCVCIAFAKCPLFSRSWATTSFFDIFHLVNEHFCASLKIECARAQTAPWRFMCAHYSFNIFHVSFCCRRRCRSRFAIVIISPTQAQIRVCSVSPFTTSIAVVTMRCICCCYHQMDEYISIRMENYLTLNFMRHWIIENWHMYISIATATSFGKKRRRHKRWWKCMQRCTC